MPGVRKRHLFDNACVWKGEFATAEDHNLHDGMAYRATMIVSGEFEQKCNPLHARKIRAGLQAANGSETAVFLDYRHHRGHLPGLPLKERVEALTDRMTFPFDQLQVDCPE